MAKREPSPEQLGYEQAIERLEDLIERIESGEIGLEESLKQYETGMALIRRCRAILSTAERKIAELTADGAGDLRVRGEAPLEDADADPGGAADGGESDADDDDLPI